MASVAFVVLAAGAGRRFGGRKLDAGLDGKALGRWATDAVEKAGATHRFIVVNPHPPDFTHKLKGWHLLFNPEHKQGIGTSIHTAINAVRNYDRVVFSLADMPFVDASNLKRLGEETGATFTRQRDGKPGVPAAFPQSVFDILLDLPNDRGAAFIAARICFSVIGAASDTHLLDVDTRNVLANIRLGKT